MNTPTVSYFQDDHIHKEAKTIHTKRLCCERTRLGSPASITQIPQFVSSVTVSMPATQKDAIEARLIMAREIRSVYINLVVSQTFISTDVFDNEGMLENPLEDPMGVVATAVTTMRLVYPGDKAASALKPGSYMTLETECRCYMAAALFIAYKAKSEDCWVGGSMAEFVLSKFLSKKDFNGNGVDCFKKAEILTNYEVKLLKQYPMFSLIDSNVYSMVECLLWKFMHASSLTRTTVLTILSVFNFYYTLCVTSKSSSEIIETFYSTYGISPIPMGFIIIGALSVDICDNHNKGSTCSSKLVFDEHATEFALQISSRASETNIQSLGTCDNKRLHTLTSRKTVISVKKLLLHKFKTWSK